MDAPGGPRRTPRTGTVSALDRPGTAPPARRTLARVHPRFADPQSETLWRLTERVKELTALHGLARLTQDDAQTPEQLLHRAVGLLPPAWQHPAEARLRCGGHTATTPGWRDTPWRQVAPFVLTTGEAGCVEVAYPTHHPDEAEGPFLGEERSLIDSFAEILRNWFEQRAARQGLEAAVDARTVQLREMANALFLAGEQERRTIAESLHDHVGQSLAFVRMRLLEIRGNAVFCGFEEDLGQVLRLLDGALRYTRDLTCELSPPQLYVLGLDAALESLVQRFATQHKLGIRYRGDAGGAGQLDADRAILYAVARELLTNVVKHARARAVDVTLRFDGAVVRLVVRDDGVGFDPAREWGGCFGLYSARERLRTRGGTLEVDTSPGQGAEVVVELPWRRA